MHLERLISVLETVSLTGRNISAAEVQRLTNLPRPTCYRLIQTLVSHGLLDNASEKGTFKLGDRFKRIALMGRTDADMRLAAAGILKEAAVTSNDAYFLSRMRNNGVEIIHVETPDDPSVSFINPGLGFRPMHACSCSKAIAAFSDDGFQCQILKRSMKAYTENTKTDAESLKAEFQEIRTKGFAECVQEIEVGISSVAAPVLLRGGAVPFSIGTIGSIRRFTQDRRARLGKELIGIADEIRNRMEVGYFTENHAPAAG